MRQGQGRTSGRNALQSSFVKAGVPKSELRFSKSRTSCLSVSRPGLFPTSIRSVAVLAGQRLCRDDVVGPDPSGRADRETHFGARCEFSRGLLVAAQVGGLRRGEIGLRVISLPAIGHGKLGVAERRLAFA